VGIGLSSSIWKRFTPTTILFAAFHSLLKGECGVLDLVLNVAGFDGSEAPPMESIRSGILRRPSRWSRSGSR
jgi:hypothetical protein